MLSRGFFVVDDVVAVLITRLQQAFFTVATVLVSVDVWPVVQARCAGDTLINVCRSHRDIYLKEI